MRALRVAMLTVMTTGLGACGAFFRPRELERGRQRDRRRRCGGDREGRLRRDRDGVYTCCGPEQGVSCWTADAGLVGSDVETDGDILASNPVLAGNEANCFRYGGDFGGCIELGEIDDGKDMGGVCCDGLTRANLLAPSDAGDDAGACPLGGPVSAVQCIPCGNGVCDPSENRCTFPQDCRD